MRSISPTQDYVFGVYEHLNEIIVAQLDSILSASDHGYSDGPLGTLCDELIQLQWFLSDYLRREGLPENALQDVPGLPATESKRDEDEELPW